MAVVVGARLLVLETFVTPDIGESLPGVAPGGSSSSAPLRVALFSNQELIRAGLACLLQRHQARAVTFDPSETACGHDVIVFDLVSAVGQARAPALRQLRRLVKDNPAVVAVTRDACDELAA